MELSPKVALLSPPSGSRQRGPQIQKRHQWAALGCYKATVNESETINEAKPLCMARGRGETAGKNGRIGIFAAVPSIERS